MDWYSFVQYEIDHRESDVRRFGLPVLLLLNFSNSWVLIFSIHLLQVCNSKVTLQRVPLVCRHAKLSPR